MRPQRGKTPAKTPIRQAIRTPSRTRSTNTDDCDPVEVSCRIRPLEGEKCIKMVDDRAIRVYQSEGRNEMEYKFSKVFGETISQKAIFDSIANPLVDGLLHGKNGLLFTYGITSSGKTYTMTGHGDDQGILPRSLDMVFNSIENLQARKYVFMPDKQNGFDVQSEADAMLEMQRREILPGKRKTEKSDYANRQKDSSKVEDVDEDSNFAVFVSFVEIYNNHIYDLLEELPYDPITGNKPPQHKILREDTQRVMFVHNVCEVEVKSTEEAFEILARGQKRRKVAHTVLNAESSRSHSVFNIRLVQAPLDPTGRDILTDKNRTVVSQLSLVDLAGSERTNRTKNTGDRLKEAGQINQSLMTLRQCIDLLRENQKTGGNKMVPYRDSKITHLFKNYFDGEGSVRMVVCVNPKASEYDETLHVMRFAEAAQEVQVHRAHEKRPMVDANFISGRRKMAAAGIQVVPDPPAVQLSAAIVAEAPHAPVPFSHIYALPQFPNYEELGSNSNADLNAIGTHIDNIGKIRSKAMQSVQRKQDAFRSALLLMDKDNLRLTSRVNSLEESLRERDALIDENAQEKARVERKLLHLQRENEELRKRTNYYQSEKRELENELQNKDWEIHQVDYEKERLKQEFEDKVHETEAGCQRAIEEERLRIEQEALDKLTVKERKLRLIKNFVNSSDMDSLGGSDETSVRSTPQPQSRPKTATPGYAASTRSSRATTRRPVKQRAQSPPATVSRPTPVRSHRRSRSVGERWLEHRPEQLLTTDTVMQPKMKKKKSVSKLAVKDTSKASRYILTTQDMDSAGHVETKLVKGDCMNTPGGGSAVVFTEVETLKQTSPGDRKRRYLEQRPEDYEGEWTDTEERCNVAMEGHGVYKRVRQLERAASQSK